MVCIVSNIGSQFDLMKISYTKYHTCRGNLSWKENVFRTSMHSSKLLKKYWNNGQIESYSKTFYAIRNNWISSFDKKQFSKEVQWELFKVDTIGTNTVVHFRQVSTLDRLGLWYFDQCTNISRQNIFSALGRCPL